MPTRLTDQQRRHRRNIRARDRNEVIKAQLRLQPCEICGTTPADRHHIDYSDPERIMWLCKAHHGQTHSQFGKPAPEWMSDIRAAMARIDAQRPSLRAAKSGWASNGEAGKLEPS